jgi:hypothetical protein
MYMWRAVDSAGQVLDVTVQPKRDKAAAAKLLRRLLKWQGFAPMSLSLTNTGLTARRWQMTGFSGRHEHDLRPSTGPKTRTSRGDDGSARRRASNRRFVAIHAAVYNVVNVQGHLIRRATLHSCRAEVYPACQSAQDWVPLIGVEKDWMPITPNTGSLSHCESQSSSISSPVGGCSLCNEK